MEKDNYITKVIFRKFKHNNAIIAFFSEEIHNKNQYTIWSYMSQGGHGGADYFGMLKNTVLATEEEYKGLKSHLKNGFGYNFKGLKRAKIDWNKINNNYGNK